MQMPIHDFSESRPSYDECRIERIVDDVYRCLANTASKCKYALPAGSVYCLHPNQRNFQSAIFLDSPLKPIRFAA